MNFGPDTDFRNVCNIIIVIVIIIDTRSNSECDGGCALLGLPFTRPYTFWVCCQVASTTGSFSIRSSDSRCGSRALLFGAAGSMLVGAEVLVVALPFSCTLDDMLHVVCTKDVIFSV
uniref:Uncharacterized protein n=1 Tax=Anopheles maculatus TaxID=74869 RepID=A0A182SFX4_9DIPT